MMEWSTLGLIVQVALIACVLAAAGAFILHAFDMVEDHRARIRAKHASDVQHYQITPTYHVFIRGRRDRAEFVEFGSPPVSEPLPQVDMRQTPIYANGEQVAAIREPGYYHAVEVLSQSRRVLGDTSDRIIPAAQFSGSPETWQSGVDWLRVGFGVQPQPGRGTWTGDQHPTLLALFRAVTKSIPPTPNGNGQNHSGT